MPFLPDRSSGNRASGDVQVHQAWARLMRILAHGTTDAHRRVLRARTRMLAVVR